MGKIADSFGLRAVGVSVSETNTSFHFEGLFQLGDPQIGLSGQEGGVGRLRGERGLCLLTDSCHLGLVSRLSGALELGVVVLALGLYELKCGV